MNKELRQLALESLIISEPKSKRIAVTELCRGCISGDVKLDISKEIINTLGHIPGRPALPILVDPLTVKKRSMNTLDGRAALIHALAHIEFNAINLALDAIWRFPNLPEDYYKDWLKVAQEESYHFELLSNYLTGIGYGYGSFDAHNSLWEMVEKTKNDPLARMALVPRTMESRGLDALPLIRKRFIQINDKEMTSILEVILNDEVGHVEIGNRWFNYLCDKDGIDPVDIYSKLVVQYKAPTLRGPFNIEARRAAGFTDRELEALAITNN